MRVGPVGHQPQGLPKTLDGLIELAALFQRQAQVVVQAGRRGIEFQCTAAARDGFLRATLAAIDEIQVVVKRRIA